MSVLLYITETEEAYEKKFTLTLSLICYLNFLSRFHNKTFLQHLERTFQPKFVIIREVR